MMQMEPYHSARASGTRGMIHGRPIAIWLAPAESILESLFCLALCAAHFQSATPQQKQRDAEGLNSGTPKTYHGDARATRANTDKFCRQLEYARSIDIPEPHNLYRHNAGNQSRLLALSCLNASDEVSELKYGPAVVRRYYFAARSKSLTLDFNRKRNRRMNRIVLVSRPN